MQNEQKVGVNTIFFSHCNPKRVCQPLLYHEPVESNQLHLAHYVLRRMGSHMPYCRWHAAWHDSSRSIAWCNLVL